MTQDQDIRTRLLFRDDQLESLAQAHVAIFGVGGVGGYVCEALVRGGVRKFDLIDADIVDISNLNRQIIATYDTIGQYKVDVMRKRMVSIRPNAEISVHPIFFLPEQSDDFDWSSYTYIVDAVDTVTAKIALIRAAKAHDIPILSSMGTGNKLDPSQFRIADLSETHTCPLARVMRRELKKYDIEHVKVVFSPEKPQSVPTPFPGSTSFCPPTAGMILASEVIRDIAGI